MTISYYSDIHHACSYHMYVLVHGNINMHIDWADFNYSMGKLSFNVPIITSVIETGDRA